MPLYCPKCRAEYRDGFTTCYDCEVYLVRAEELDHHGSPADDPGSGSIDGMECLRAGPYWELSEIYKHLYEKGVPCRLKEIKEAEGKSCCSKVRGLYGIFVGHGDLDRAVEAQQNYLQCLFEKDGVDLVETVVDLDSGPVSCPACGETLHNGKNECPSCGLFLGAPDQDDGEEGCCG